MKLVSIYRSLKILNVSIIFYFYFKLFYYKSIKFKLLGENKEEQKLDNQ